MNKVLFTRRIALVLLLLCPCLWASAQTLLISWPKDGAVFQRDQYGQGTFSVAGSFNSKALRLNYYRMRATLTPIDVQTGNTLGTPAIVQELPTDESTVISATLFNVPQGWYRLTVTAYPASSQYSRLPTYSSPSQKVGVGDVFIISGQSNAQGLPNTSVSNKVAGTLTYDGVRVQTDYFGPAAYANISPTQYLQIDYSKVSKLTAVRDAATNPANGIAPVGPSLWFWADLGQRLVQYHKNQGNQVPVAFFNAAWSGTTITDWARSTNPNNYVWGRQGSTIPYNRGQPYSLLWKTIQLYASLYGVRGVLWQQGETDSEALNAKVFRSNAIIWDMNNFANWPDCNSG